MSHFPFSMPRSKPSAAVVGGSADDVEAAFYEALQKSDLEKLMACWADEDDVVCVHPGGPRLVGVGAIRAAFEALFNQSSVQIKLMNVRRVESVTSVVHSVLERIDVLTGDGPVQAWVVATNVYHRTGQGWRLVLHHASPGTQNQALEAFEVPPVLH